MDPSLQPLLDLAFDQAPAREANLAIARAREAAGESATSYEVVVAEGQTLAQLAAAVLPKLVYHLESRGAFLPECGEVFFSLFVGETIHFVGARQGVPLLAEAMGLKIDALSALYGTGELRRALRPGEKPPAPRGSLMSPARSQGRMTALPLALVLAVGPVHVQAGALPGGDGSAERPFAKLSLALAHAPAGGTLALGPGLYEEALTVNRPLTLVGSGHAVIAAGSEAAAAVTIRSEVKLSNLTVQGGRIGVRVASGTVTLERSVLRGQPDAAIDCGDARCTLSHVQLVSSFAGAVGVRGRGSIALNDVRIGGPFRRAIDLDHARLDAEGLAIDGSVTGLQALASEVKVARSTFQGLRGNCIFVAGGALTLDSALLSGCEYGLLIRDAATVTLRRSIVSGCKSAGVSEVGAKVRLSDLVVLGPSRDGALTFDGGEARLDDVLIRAPGPTGIRARLAKVTLHRVHVSGAALDASGDFGNAAFFYDSVVSGGGLSARRCAGAAVEVQLGSGSLKGLDVELGGLAALALEHAGKLDVAGLSVRGGSGTGVACIEGGRARLIAPRFEKLAADPYLVDCSCKVEVSPEKWGPAECAGSGGR